MARASSVEQLPPDILEQLQALLRDPRVTQLDAVARINAVLADAGYQDRISKSAVNRYDLRMREVGDRLRQSRQVSEMWIAKLGAAPQGQVGHLVNEILRTLAFDLSLQLQNGELSNESMPAAISMLKELSLSVMRLERASSENVKREQQIREQERAKAAEAVVSTAKKSGVSPETIERIRRDVLRME